MTQYSLSLDSYADTAGVLLVRDSDGQTQPAQRQEILRVARELVDTDELRGRSLSSPTAVRDFLRLKLNASLEHEVCGMILVDTQHRVIEYWSRFVARLIRHRCIPREVVKLALVHNAKAIFLVQNHPSGTVEASEADIRLTKHLKQALALIDVTLLDHFIVAGSKVLSMAEKGLV